MSKSELRAKSVAEAVNLFKKGAKEFTREEFTSFLKNQKIPYHQYMFGILKKASQIKTVGTALYAFTSSEPVYYKTLQQSLDAMADYYAKAAKKSVEKKSIEKKSSSITVVAESVSDLEAAIMLLKKNGYKILKPIIEYKEL